jgi:hypothetical protein
MSRHLDLSWDAIPHDGAFAPVDLVTSFDRSEADELFQAWCHERQESIELRFYLDEGTRLLKRILAEGDVSTRSRKRAKRWLQLVNLPKPPDLEEQD